MLRFGLFFGVSWVIACGSSGGGGGSGGPPQDSGGELEAPPAHVTLVSSFESAALIAVLDAGGGGALRLLNPNAGKWSEPITVAAGVDAPFAFSPDGQRAVYGAAGGDLGRTWVVVSIGLADDGTPVVTETARFDTLTTERVPVWNGQGDRFFTQTGWFDPSSGRSVECGSGQPRVIASPDGRHAIFECDDPAIDGVHFDGELVYPQVEHDFFSADGQLMTSGVHVPSRAELPADKKPTRAPTGLEVGGWANRFHQVGNGAAGLRAQELDGIFGKVVRPWGPLSIQNARTDAVTYYAGRTTEPSARWEGPADTLLALPEGQNGASARFAGFHPNGRQAVYVVALWDVASDGVNDTAANIVHSQRLALVDLATGAVDAVVERGRIAGQDGVTVTDVDTYWFGDFRELQLLYRWPYGAQPKHAAVVRDDRALMRLGDSWWGLSGGAAHAVPSPAQLPTSDGGAFVGTFRTRLPYEGDAIGAVCHNTGEEDSAVRCIRTAFIPQVVAAGGHAVAGLAKAGEGARIWSISQSAGYAGQEIVLYGTGFGESGALFVGGVEVAAASIEHWSDTEVRFLVTAGMASGPVRVEGPEGAVVARPFHFHVTEYVETGWDGVESIPAHLFQGLNIIRHAGELVAWRPMMLNPPVFPLGAEVDFEADIGEGGSWVYLNSMFEQTTEFLVGDRLGDWIRPLPSSVGPGLPPLLDGWNPVGPATWPALAPIQFVTFMGRLVEQNSCAVYARLDAGNLGFGFIDRPNGEEPCPRAFVDEGGSALAIRSRPAVGPYMMRVTELQAQRDVAGTRYIMAFDDSVATPLPIGMSALAALDEGLLVVGRMENDPNAAAWVLDPPLSGVKTPEVADEARRPLAAPTAISQGPYRGYVAVEIAAAVQPVTPTLAHFDLEGHVEWDALEAPLTEASGELRMWGQGAELVAHRQAAPPDFEGSGAAIMDTAADAPTWSPLLLPEGPVVSVFDDAARDRLLVASKTHVYAMERGPDGFGEATLVGQPALSLFDVDIEIFGVGATPDGSLLVQTRTRDARPGREDNPLPFGGWYWLPAAATP